ncbi:hypothetical protein [Cellulomonas cellasea]|uniref:Uncharacterized protein n=2 Tax=Cellulomonas cellasea TaxID=43670 RepID=A0A0A0B3V2_9CELL|nr:hypothetical protein [Cellulomonas cellasea]KGM00863.1 hypothetical protein Q760_05500 [Cellulomonas cellasea DSM 20118]GEA86415.1 hypothetical protein CCE01nite_03640 [Cellulomonas cellasea]
MTDLIRPSTLYRFAAVAGIGSALVLLVNAAKRAELLPTTAATQLVAPLAQVLALALVTGLYVAAGRRSGVVGSVAFVLNALALSLLVGVEFVLNLVFVEVPAATVADLRGGPLGSALVVTSVLFLLGTLLYVGALLRTRRVPVVPLVLYAAGAVPVALRAFVPELVLDLGLVMLAAGIGSLAVWLWTQAPGVVLARVGGRATAAA